MSGGSNPARAPKSVASSRPHSLAPGLAVHLVSMALAATDHAHHRHFATAAERYRRTLVGTMNQEFVRSLLAFGARPGERPRPGPKVPDFAYEPPGLVRGLSRAAWAIGLLAGLARGGMGGRGLGRAPRRPSKGWADAVTPWRALIRTEWRLGAPPAEPSGSGRVPSSWRSPPGVASGAAGSGASAPKRPSPWPRTRARWTALETRVRARRPGVRSRPPGARHPGAPAWLGEVGRHAIPAAAGPAGLPSMGALAHRPAQIRVTVDSLDTLLNADATEPAVLLAGRLDSTWASSWSWSCPSFCLP